MNSFDTALDALREILAARASGPAVLHSMPAALS
jgi:hypothetical protein